MTQRKAETVLDFETLCLGIERCDADLLLGFYADDALVSIVNADVPLGPPFELRGKAEIAKHLRAAFGQEASHRVERQEIVREGDRVRFQEVCENPDGNRIVVETTLEVREGKIFRQVDVVARNARADSEEENGRNLPDRKKIRREPAHGRTPLQPTVFHVSNRQPRRRISDDAPPY